MSDKHYSKAAIDLVATGATLLFTTENGARRFYVEDIFVVVTAADTLSVVASASFGTNSTDYNNILAITALTGTLAVNKSLKIPIVLAVDSVAANTGIYIKITTGATAVSASGKVIVRGFYE